MPEGLVKNPATYRYGNPVPATDAAYDSNPVPAENPSLNTNPVPAADPTFDTNPVTWTPDPAHFGTPVTLP